MITQLLYSEFVTAIFSKINGKLNQYWNIAVKLELTEAKTKGILARGNVETIERHLDAFRKLSMEVDGLKIQVEQAKVAKGDTLQEVPLGAAELK